MDLVKYFDENNGVGILGTFQTDGAIDLALYAKPVMVDENTIALVMKQRQSHENLKTYLQAAYLFLAEGSGYNGLRLHLTKLREESNRAMIAELRKKRPSMFAESDDSQKFLVFFQVDRIRPLVGEKFPETQAD